MVRGAKGMPDPSATWHHSMGICCFGQKRPMPSGNSHFCFVVGDSQGDGAQPMPAMTLRPECGWNVRPARSKSAGSPSGTKALAITEEPAGGSPHPYHHPRSGSGRCGIKSKNKRRARLSLLALHVTRAAARHCGGAPPLLASGRVFHRRFFESLARRVSVP